MIIVRFVIGFFKTLVNLWGWREWFYYNKTGLDPKLPAFKRWDLVVKKERKQAETEVEQYLPVENNWINLKDKFMQSPDETIFYSTDKDKVDALVEEYERELRTRSSGDFYYSMVKGRNLDFIHNYKVDVETVKEGTEIDEEQAREKFLR